MGRFDLDYSHVKNVVAPDRVPVAGNEHRMIRVAFDFFRLDGDENECLWQVQADDDGNEFLVRTYDMPDESDDSLEARAADWSVMLDAKKANLTIAYKGVPIHRLAAADYGACDPDEARLLRDMVSEKLAADEQWAARLLSSLPTPKLAALGETFPELAKTARHWRYVDELSKHHVLDMWRHLPNESRDKLLPAWGTMDDTGIMNYFSQEGRMWKLQKEAEKFGYSGPNPMDIGMVEGVEKGIPWPDEPPQAYEQLLRVWRRMDDQQRDKVVPGWRNMLIHQIVEDLMRAKAAEQASAAEDDASVANELLYLHSKVAQSLKRQGGYDALSDKKKELFNDIADWLMDAKLSGKSIEGLKEKISEFEAGDWPPRGKNIHQLDRKNPDDMYNLAWMAAQSAPRDLEIKQEQDVGDDLLPSEDGMLFIVGTKEWSGGSKPVTEYWLFKKAAGSHADDAPPVKENRFRTIMGLAERFKKAWEGIKEPSPRQEELKKAINYWLERLPMGGGVLDDLSERVYSEGKARLSSMIEELEQGAAGEGEIPETAVLREREESPMGQELKRWEKVMGRRLGEVKEIGEKWEARYQWNDDFTGARFYCRDDAAAQSFVEEVRKKTGYPGFAYGQAAVVFYQVS